MRLDRPFLQLPVRFDAEILAREAHALPNSAWLPHPQGYPGNDAVPLVSPDGEVTDDIDGAMAPTKYLEASPYIRSIMADLDGVWGRSRLMGLAPGGEVRLHVDVHYYWRTHLRIHIPVITNPVVRFTCGGETVHMAAGECWVFDSFQPHRVENAGQEKRVHLVLDTVGGERLWDLVEAAKAGTPIPEKPLSAGAEVRPLMFEQVNVPLVMTPWEMRCHADYILEHAEPSVALEPVAKQLDRFITAWQAAWSRFGTAKEGLPVYQDLVSCARASLEAAGGAEVKLRNDSSVALAAEALIFWNALARSPHIAAQAGDAAQASAPVRSSLPYRERFDRPVFIVSSPRSGSTLLFETLAQAPNAYSPGGESHGIIETIAPLSVPGRDWSSNRLEAGDATDAIAEQLTRAFYLALRDREDQPPPERVRMIEKTPKNALRIPFFDSIWPDAQFLFLYRDPRQTMSSMLEAWLSGAFRTYPNLPGWQGPPWSLLLVPGWQQLSGTPLPNIVARQWATAMSILIDDLSALPKERVRVVDHDSFLAAPQATAEALAASLGLEWDRQLESKLPLSRYTVSQPGPDKWRQIEDVIESMMPIVAAADAKAREFIASMRGEAAQAPQATAV